MQKDSKLQSKFAPLWFQNASLLKQISKSAFIIFFFYRSTIDSPETRISLLTDTEIEQETGMPRSTIRRAREELYKNFLLRREGYHKYFVARYERFNSQNDK